MYDRVRFTDMTTHTTSNPLLRLQPFSRIICFSHDISFLPSPSECQTQSSSSRHGLLGMSSYFLSRSRGSSSRVIRNCSLFRISAARPSRSLSKAISSHIQDRFCGQIVTTHRCGFSFYHMQPVLDIRQSDPYSHTPMERLFCCVSGRRTTCARRMWY